MPDVRFENRLHAGADFRVEASGPEFYLRRITLRRDVPVRDGPYAHSNAVSITLGSSLISHGLALVHAPDSVNYATIANGQRLPWRAIRGPPAQATFISPWTEPSRPRIRGLVPWKWNITARILPDSESSTTARTTAQPRNTKQPARWWRAAGRVWATNIFDLPTPRFKNAQNDEADFRLNTFNNQLFVRKVTLRPRE